MIQKENYIRRNPDKVAWSYISYHQKLNESFIREFKDKVDWFYISQRQVLSEDFIIEMKDYVDWNCIDQFQNLSEKFREEFKDKLIGSDNAITNQAIKLLKKIIKLKPIIRISDYFDKEGNYKKEG